MMVARRSRARAVWVPSRAATRCAAAESVGFWYEVQWKKFPRATPIQHDVWYRIGRRCDQLLISNLISIQLDNKLISSSADIDPKPKMQVYAGEPAPRPSDTELTSCCHFVRSPRKRVCSCKGQGASSVFICPKLRYVTWNAEKRLLARNTVLENRSAGRARQTYPTCTVRQEVRGRTTG